MLEIENSYARELEVALKQIVLPNRKKIGKRRVNKMELVDRGLKVKKRRKAILVDQSKKFNLNINSLINSL